MLKTDLNLDAPDDVYEMLVDAHRGLAPEESRRLDARLVLLLANHVGNQAVIGEAIAQARTGLGSGDPGAENDRAGG